MKARFIILISMIFLVFSLCIACGNENVKTDGQSTFPEAAEIPSATDTASEQNTADDLISYLPLSVGDTAPDFTAALADGSEFTLSDEQGKVILLNFWATWCGPCVREMPAFERLKEDYGGDVAILAVNCMEDADTVAAFIEENGYTFPIAIDEEGVVSMKYPTQGIPYTLVIDADGVIQNIYMGAADADTQYKEYKSAIDAVAEAAEE